MKECTQASGQRVALWLYCRHSNKHNCQQTPCIHIHLNIEIAIGSAEFCNVAQRSEHFAIISSTPGEHSMECSQRKQAQYQTTGGEIAIYPFGKKQSFFEPYLVKPLIKFRDDLINNTHTHICQHSRLFSKLYELVLPKARIQNQKHKDKYLLDYV